MSSADLGIVVGVDGTVPSRAAVHWAARTARDRDLPVTLMHAVSLKSTPVTNRLMVFGTAELPHRRVARIIGDALDIVAASVCRGEPPKTGTSVVAADPLDTLVELSAGAELIVVGARRRSPWRAFRGSLGPMLVLRSHCPVAVVRDNNPSTPHPAHAPVSVAVTGWSSPES